MPRRRLRIRTSLTFSFLLLALGAAVARAQELAPDRLTFRGFGTIGATTHDTDGVVYHRNSGQADGARSGEVDLATDSLAGVQVDLRIVSKLDLVLQGVTRQRASGDWKPRLSQGFLRFSPDGSFVARVGRIGYDAYLLAESRQVGYSYIAVRPSPDFYGQISNDDIDGVDVAYALRFGRGIFKARLYGGDSEGEIALADGSHREFEANIDGASVDWLQGGWTARVAYLRYRLRADDQLPLLAGALRATGFPSALAVADDIDRDQSRSRGLQLGLAYDDGPMVAQLMVAHITSDSIVAPDVRKLYAQVGYRVGKWTPFGAYARSHDREPVRDAGLPNAPMLAPLNAAVIGLQRSSRSTQHTASLGVRYDLNSHVDFKFQVDRTHVTDSSIHFDRRPDAGTPYALTAFTAAVDFVF
jgi:hypothetical protein